MGKHIEIPKFGDDPIFVLIFSKDAKITNGN